jgi:hypothetical protein
VTYSDSKMTPAVLVLSSFINSCFVTRLRRVTTEPAPILLTLQLFNFSTARSVQLAFPIFALRFFYA